MNGIKIRSLHKTVEMSESPHSIAYQKNSAASTENDRIHVI